MTPLTNYAKKFQRKPLLRNDFLQLFSAGFIKNPEPAISGVLYKELFLKISEAKAFHLKVKARLSLNMAALESPEAAPKQVFSCEYCEIFKNTYFEKHLQTTVSVDSKATKFQESLALPFK